MKEFKLILLSIVSLVFDILALYSLFEYIPNILSSEVFPGFFTLFFAIVQFVICLIIAIVLDLYTYKKILKYLGEKNEKN